MNRADFLRLALGAPLGFIKDEPTQIDITHRVIDAAPLPAFRDQDGTQWWKRDGINSLTVYLT